MLPASHRFIDMLVTSCIKLHVAIYPYKLVKVTKLFDLVVTKCTKYKNMQKFMVQFISKFENRGIKIAQVNSIRITKSINLQLFTVILHGVGGDIT